MSHHFGALDCGLQIADCGFVESLRSISYNEPFDTEAHDRPFDTEAHDKQNSFNP